MCHPEVEQRPNVAGEAVADGHRVSQVHFSPQMDGKIAQHGAKEGRMRLANRVPDADSTAVDAERRQTWHSGELPAYPCLRVIHKRLACLIERQEPIAVGGEVDRNASLAEMLEEAYRIRKDRGMLGNCLPIMVGDCLDDCGSDRQVTGVQSTGDQGVPRPFLDLKSCLR